MRVTLLKNIKIGDRFVVLDPITLKDVTGVVRQAKHVGQCVSPHYVYVRCEDGQVINTMKDHPVRVVE